MLRIATLNIWFDEKLRKARTKALLEVILQMDADVICLQEVVPQVAAALVAWLPRWSCSDPGDGSTVAPYGVMALVAPRIDDVQFSFHDLPTFMCRRLLVTHIRGVAVGTVHLESLASHPVREKQLRVCRRVLAPHSDALLVGDFNFDSHRNFSPPHNPLENEALVNIVPDFVDVWPALQSDRGLTFDSAVNPYIGKSEQMRYDRVMVRLAKWGAASIDMFGHQAVDDLVQLSPLEKEHAQRPPTPQRPVRRHREPLSWGQHSASASTGCAQMPAVSSAEGEHTPPRARSKFFLSDHFGLIVDLAPIQSDLGMVRTD